MLYENFGADDLMIGIWQLSSSFKQLLFEERLQETKCDKNAAKPAKQKKTSKSPEAAC